MRYLRRASCVVLSALTFLLGDAVFPVRLSSVSAAEYGRPNIVMILVDDLGYGDLRYMGAPDLKSPSLDTLAARGIKFSNFYANCPVCSPTRAALLTGRYQALVGVPGVVRTHAENNWGYLSESATLLPLVLKPAGYHTASIGKWHLGLDSPNTPMDRGFDHLHGFLGDMMDDYYNHRRHGINYMYHDRTEIDPKGHATDLFTQWAIDYVTSREADQPYFMYLAYNAPHTPIQPPPEWIAKVKARESGITDQRASLVALIEHMDDGIGKVLSTIEQRTEAGGRPTIVLFSSDNGGQIEVGANNGPLRDGKQSVYQGGLKVPTCAASYGSELIKAGSSTSFQAMTMDLFPTICEFAGATIDHPIEGRSIVPTLLGKKQDKLRDHWFFTRREGGTRYQGKTIDAVIRGPWKLLQNSPFEPLELYNLDTDPKETTDLAQKNRGIFNELSVELHKQLQREGAVPWQKP
ncbi:MAG: sulfatase-like hydrolase/transferase [Planctomycetota bacterium]|nr:sulfatase-like hydrolase/transferase [Planctomycetota bacterium]